MFNCLATNLVSTRGPGRSMLWHSSFHTQDAKDQCHATMLVGPDLALRRSEYLKESFKRDLNYKSASAQNPIVLKEPRWTSAGSASIKCAEKLPTCCPMFQHLVCGRRHCLHSMVSRAQWQRVASCRCCKY